MKVSRPTGSTRAKVSGRGASSTRFVSNVVFTAVLYSTRQKNRFMRDTGVVADLLPEAKATPTAVGAEAMVADEKQEATPWK